MCRLRCAPSHASGRGRHRCMVLRVSEDLAALAPHRPERARFAHSVLHGTASRTSAVAMDDTCDGQRIARHQPQELLPSNVALPRTPRQPFAPDPPRPMDHGGQALIVAGDAEVSKVPLQHPAKSTLLIGDWPGPHAAALLVDRFERTRQAIFGGTLPHRRRFTLPRLAPRMEKAEERK